MAILFDLDGTLIDTAPDFMAAINSLRSTMDLPPLHVSMLPRLRLAVAEGIKAITQVGFEHTHKDNDSTLCHELLEVYQQTLGLHAKLFMGIEALLKTLEQQQIPWGVVTNKQSRFTEPLLQQLGLSDRATCIVSGDTTPYLKPHPEPLFHACKQIKLPPSRCVFIGDAEQDIIAGRTVGMTTVVALFGYIKDLSLVTKWGADHCVLHPNEILPWFKKWSQTTR